MSKEIDHRLLKRQLRKLKIAGNQPPSQEQWEHFLGLVENTYSQADEEKYLVEHSFSVASQEMQALHTALRDERDKLQAVMDHVGNVILTVDDAGMIQSANQSVYRLFNYVTQSVVGQHISLLFPPITTKQDTFIWDTDHFEDGRFLSREVIAQRQDGHHFPASLLINCTLIGNKRQFIVLIEDITARKKIQKDIEDQRQLFSNLVTVSRVITQSPSLRNTVHNILDVIITLTNVKKDGRNSLFVFNEEGDYTCTMLTRDNVLIERLEGIAKDSIESGLAGWVALNREAALINDTSQDDRWSPLPEDIHTAQSALCVPILLGVKLLGILTLTHPEKEHFTSEHAQLTQAASLQIALALRNAQMYESQLRLAIQQRTLYETLRTVGSLLKYESVADIAVKTVSEFTNWSIVGIALVDEPQENLVLIANTDSTNVKKGELVPIGQSVMGQAFLTGKTQYIHHVGETPHYFSYHGLPAASELAVPLRQQEKVIGVLNIESTEVDAFSHEDVSLVESLAETISLALSNAHLHEELSQAKEVAEIASRVKSDFVATVSHELKNPMTAIKGYTNLLHAGIAGEITEQQAQFLDIVNASVLQMERLVADLTDIIRIESGQFTLSPDYVSVKEVVNLVVAAIKPQVEEKGQTLTVQLPANEVVAWVDRSRLMQICSNLISNAHKYTEPEGEITIQVREKIGVREQDSEVYVKIVDTGLGIKLEDQKRLFQQFFRADDTAARKVAGTGLGLNITKKLLELQGGKIWFESEFRKGTTFHFTLPTSP